MAGKQHPSWSMRQRRQRRDQQPQPSPKSCDFSILPARHSLAGEQKTETHGPVWASLFGWVCGCGVWSAVICGVLAGGGAVWAADWPMWRADAGRSGVWQGDLPENLSLIWQRQLPPLQPAYQNPRLQFDAGYEPVASGGLVFVGSSVSDCVTAYDAATGAQVWRVSVEGPVRCAPVVWRERVYFGSDDGHLYCVTAAEGELIWKFRAVPSERKVLGNGRLISLWPVRGGPVIADDVLYFAAGVWSFEGIFLYALDPQTGDLLWLNDRTGAIYGQHPHDTQAFGGVTPQGYLLVQGEELIVPCGTALPARFSRQTGELIHFELPKAGRQPGGWFAASLPARRGAPVPQQEQLLLDPEVNRDRHEGGWNTGPSNQAGARSRVVLNDQEFSFTEGYPGVEGTVHSLLAAEGRLFVVTLEGQLLAYASRDAEAAPPRFWSDAATAQGELPRAFQRSSEAPRKAPLADNASTGSDSIAVKEEAARETETESEQAATAAGVALAERILTITAMSHGYVLIPDGFQPGLLSTLLREPELKLVITESDPTQCQLFREQCDATGLSRERVSALQGEFSQLGLPPFWAGLIVVQAQVTSRMLEALQDSTEVEPTLQTLFQALRPYDGTAFLVFPEGDEQTWQRWEKRLVAAVRQLDEQATVQRVGNLLQVQRPQGIPGGTNYTDGWESADENVQAPLGVLWFDDRLAHFKRAPQPMIVDGVMISYDKDWLGWVDGVRPPFKLVPPRYSDIYTGRIFSDEESSQLAQALPTRDLQQPTLTQYRPETQKNPWKPEQPKIGERVNPLTGQTEVRAIHKQYGCDGGVDYGLLYTLRSGTAAYYDKRLESGTIHISGPRSGCTNSIIPAGGILNVPYFYQGCTCSYPLPVGLAMISLPPEHEQWAVWGTGGADNIQRIGINLGAPGARMTPAGTLWLEYPQVGGPAPQPAWKTVPAELKTYYRHAVWSHGGTGWPWVVGSGGIGIQEFLLQQVQPGEYVLRLHFAEPEDLQPGERVFDVEWNGQTLLKDFDPVAEAGGPRRALVKEFTGLNLTGELQLRFIPRSGEPVIGGIELMAHDLPRDDLPVLPDRTPHKLPSP